MAQATPHRDTVKRAVLPEVLFVPDLALALLISESAVRRALHRGECGAYIRIGRRLAVRRDEFLRALEARERPNLRLVGGHPRGGR